VVAEHDWYSEENLKRAWKYVRIEVRDDFVFDVIGHADVQHNLRQVVSSLHSQIRDNLYYPAPLLHIGVPKNDYSVRPGTTIPLVDLIVLYAIIQQLAPRLDLLLSESAYAYRLNPKAGKSGQHLFRDRSEPSPTDEEDVEDGKFEFEDEEESIVEVDFPYNWFVNWKAFRDASKLASERYEHVAVTDIAAYFENISLDLLREGLKERLGSAQRELIDRLFRLLEFWDWTPSGNLPQRIGLPQGNDISSFLSNLYLMDLDQAMLSIVSGDTSKYHRYVDDMKLFTSKRDEARRALVKLEEVLRALNLNVQSAKTKIEFADDIYDPQVELWLEKMSDDEPEKVSHAVEFFETVFDQSRLSHWPGVVEHAASENPVKRPALGQPLVVIHEVAVVRRRPFDVGDAASDT